MGRAIVEVQIIVEAYLKGEEEDACRVPHPPWRLRLSADMIDRRDGFNYSNFK